MGSKNKIGGKNYKKGKKQSNNTRKEPCPHPDTSQCIAIISNMNI